MTEEYFGPQHEIPPYVQHPPPPVKIRKPFPGILQSCGLAILLIILQFVIGIAVAIVFVISDGEAMELLRNDQTAEFMDYISPAVIFVPMILIEVLVLWLGLWLARRPVSETLGLRKAPVVAYAVFFPIVLGCIILLSEVDNITRAYFPMLNVDMEGMEILFQSFFWGVFYVSLVGPLLEEFLFRGIILNGLLKRYSAPTAYFVSALLFSIVHMNPAQCVSAFFIGLLLAWMYHKTGSIWPCVFTHVFNNLLIFLLHHFSIPVQIEGFNTIPVEGVNVFQPLWFDALGVALLMIGILLLKKFLPTRKELAPDTHAAFTDS